MFVLSWFVLAKETHSPLDRQVYKDSKAWD